MDGGCGAEGGLAVVLETDEVEATVNNLVSQAGDSGVRFGQPVRYSTPERDVIEVRATGGGAGSATDILAVTGQRGSFVLFDQCG